MSDKQLQAKATEFVKDHANITDSNASAMPGNGSPREAAEQIADDLNKAMKGMSAGQRQEFMNDIAKEGQQSKHDGDYANFSKGSDGHLHVKTRGFNSPINFGMSRDSDLVDLTKKRASLGGHACDGGAGNEDL